MKLKASQNLWKPLPPSQTLCLFASAARQQPLVCFDSLKMRANLSWSAIGRLNGQLKSNPRTKWWRQKLKFRRRLNSLPHLWSSQLWQQIIMVYLWAAKWDNRSRCFQRSSRRDFRDPNGDYLSRLWAQTTRSTPSFGPWLHGVVKKSMSPEKFTLGKILIVLFLSCWMVLLWLLWSLSSCFVVNIMPPWDRAKVTIFKSLCFSVKHFRYSYLPKRWL